MRDQYGYTFKHPASLDDQREEMKAYFDGARPVYYDCRICGSFHPNGYHGDCRNDLYRIDDPDEIHGSLKWDEIPMEEAN